MGATNTDHDTKPSDEEEVNSSEEEAQETDEKTSQSEEDDSQSDSSEDFKSKFEDERKHSRLWERRANDNKKKLDEQVDKNKELSDEIDSLKAELETKDREVLISKIAGEEGVEARFLSGETEEDLRQSAKDFLTQYRPVSATPGGFVGSHGTTDEKDSSTRLSAVERAKNFKP